MRPRADGETHEDVDISEDLSGRQRERFRYRWRRRNLPASETPQYR